MLLGFIDNGFYGIFLTKVLGTEVCIIWIRFLMVEYAMITCEFSIIRQCRN